MRKDMRNRKDGWKALTALLLVMVMMLSGCGSSGGGSAKKDDPEAEVKAVVEAALTKLKEGDLEGAKAYFSEEAQQDDFFMTGTFVEQMKESLLESAGMAEDQMSEELKTSIDELAEAFNGNLLADYEITEVEVEDTNGEVEAKITYGFDWTILNDVDAGELLGENTVQDYYAEHQEELLALGDESEMLAAIFNGIMPEYIGKIKDLLLNSEGQSENWDLTLEKIEDEWKITKMTAFEDE